jgi:RHS repeat-associated protein
VDAAGAVLQQQRYLPFGAPRELSGYTAIGLTDFTYTSQRDLPEMGLMDYRARMYSARLGRFISPDSIVPGVGPQAYNRFSYVSNNPVNFNDPSGHKPCWATKKNTCNLTGDQIKALQHGSDQEQNFIKNLAQERGFRLPEDEYFATGGLWRDPSFNVVGGGGSINQSDGCKSDDIICILREHHGIDDPELWDYISITSQDVATVMSSFGAFVTLASTISGCVVGTEAGILPGCAAGYAAGSLFHFGVTNPLESILSTVSLGATGISDYFTEDINGKLWDPRTWAVGEDTKTSFTTWGVGQLITEPFVDAGIDIYASGYSHGAFCGISTVLTCF